MLENNFAVHTRGRELVFKLHRKRTYQSIRSEQQHSRRKGAEDENWHITEEETLVTPMRYHPSPISLDQWNCGVSTHSGKFGCRHHHSRTMLVSLMSTMRIPSSQDGTLSVHLKGASVHTHAPTRTHTHTHTRKGPLQLCEWQQNL